MNKQNYGEMSIPQLKDELKKRHAKLSGRKKELVERCVYNAIFLQFDDVMCICMSARLLTLITESSINLGLLL